MLLLEWQPPEEELLKKEDLPSYCGAMCALKTGKIYLKKKKKLFISFIIKITKNSRNKNFLSYFQEQEEAKKRRTITKLYKPPTTLEEINLERRLLNHIFKLISNQCDYLIEDTLKILLSEYTEENNLLIRLDKVFEVSFVLIIVLLLFTS